MRSDLSHAKWVKHCLEETDDFAYLPGDVRDAMLQLAEAVITLSSPLAGDQELVFAGATALQFAPEPDWSNVRESDIPGAAITAISRIVLRGVDVHRAASNDLKDLKSDG